MTNGDFRNLFVRALNLAADNAEKKLGKPISHSFRIELHAPGSAGALLTVDQALDQIYLGHDRFYKVVDVAIKEVSPAGSVAFVRVSGHKPAEFKETFDPAAAGPFKQISAATIEDRRVHSG
jgi:hypothetical protein